MRLIHLRLSENLKPDATRWYMISNANPWDNLRFNIDRVGEVQRKFFGTLHNTYNFFALYANLDAFTFEDAPIVLTEELKRSMDSIKIEFTNQIDRRGI